jgi:hypothetical protein
MKKLLACAFLLVLGVGIGCGSKPPPAADAPASSASADSAAPADSSASAAPGGSASADGSSDGAAPTTVASQREPFMQVCMKKLPAPDYCECAWEQFKTLFKDADMSKETPDTDPRFAQLQQQTTTACASKLPEDTVKSVFLSGCTGSEPKKAGYCACAWPALRKTLSIVDMNSDFEGPRFDDAKKGLAKACKGKYPAAVAKAEFVGACTKGDASVTARCACIWGKIRAKYSVEEYIAGMADPKATPGLDSCK